MKDNFTYRIALPDWKKCREFFFNEKNEKRISLFAYIFVDIGPSSIIPLCKAKTEKFLHMGAANFYKTNISHDIIEQIEENKEKVIIV